MDFVVRFEACACTYMCVVSRLDTDIFIHLYVYNVLV